MADAPQHAFRTERDSMGEMQIPADAYYGAQTARGVENFPVSECGFRASSRAAAAAAASAARPARAFETFPIPDLRFDRRFIAAMGLIKWACADVNHKLG